MSGSIPCASLCCSYAPDSVNHWPYYTSIDHLVVDVMDGGRLSPKVVLVGCQLLNDPQLTLRPSPYLTLGSYSKGQHCTGEASGVGFEKVNDLFLTFKKNRTF